MTVSTMTAPAPRAAGYGRELFASFVPSSARDRLDALGAPGVALLSGALVARHKPGAVVELSYPGPCTKAALAGVLRAARQSDAVVCVSVPAEARAESPHAAQRIVDDIVGAAVAARFDRPLVIAARAQPLSSGASIERLSEALYRDVSAGFTSIAFFPAAFAGDVDAFRKVTAPIVEQDLGVEVELDGATDPALVLARLDDAGLSLSAVRGADPMDELGDAFLVVPAIGMPTMRPGDADASAARFRFDIDALVQKSIGRVPAMDDERAEATAWFDVGTFFSDTAATRGSASRLLDALAHSLR